jgi:shikimate dehydrogenase
MDRAPVGARFGVLGWPVAHSRSPAMMAAAGLAYERLPVRPERFAETVLALHGAGFAGANVTIPHKEAALALATEASATARAIGAANTLTLGPGGAIAAENTDAPGLLAALGDRPAQTALVLGAGGSARAAAFGLRDAGAQVTVWNRTRVRAERLAADLGVAVADSPAPADVLVNCTSVGLEDPSTTFNDLPLAPDRLNGYATVVDLVYRPGGTLLIEEARRRGVAAVDGLEVLVQQGALSFTVWTGREAPIDAMRNAAADPDPSHAPTRLRPR